MKQISEQTGICFFRVNESVRLRDFLLRANVEPLYLRITESLVDEWLRFGSVYVDGRRVREDLTLKNDQLIRLHTRRKTYVAGDLDLLPRVIFSNNDFLVLDKPAGLPTHPTLDNYLENAKVTLEKQLGRSLYVTHRLDVATMGLLILALTPPAQAQINKLFSKRKVRKFYRALVENPVTCGLIEHYMDPESRIPKVMSVEPTEGWLDCRIEVLNCAPAQEGYRLEIELLTGRTHQIRAQLRALGSPIVGDQAYGSEKSFLPQAIALECSRLQFQFSNQFFDFEKPCSLAMS